jgi:hypothetical protein
LYQERKGSDGAPSSFVTSAPNAWEKVQFRSGLTGIEVHDRVNSVVMGREFSMDEIQQKDLFGRTHWKHVIAPSGVSRSEYRIRVMWKVFPNDGNIEFKVEAQFKPGTGNWIDGIDSDTISQLRDDLRLRLR